METPTIIEKEHYLSISLCDELFAIDVKKVLKVIEKQRITHIPNMPEFIKGVINFQGEILPIIDTRQKFNMPKQGDDDNYVIIVIELISDERDIMLGIVADEVKDVFDLKKDEIKNIPEMGTNYKSEFLKGMFHSDNGFIMILNAERVFSKDEINTISKTHEKKYSNCSQINY